VRRARSDDAAFVDALGEKSAETSISRVRPADPAVVARSFRRLSEFCRERPLVTLIAERDGERVGFLVLLVDVPDEVTQARQGFIAYMAVSPKVRRSGVARALLGAAVEEARGQGLPHLSLMVSNDNAPARALYAAAGFVDERTLMTKAVDTEPS